MYVNLFWCVYLLLFTLYVLLFILYKILCNSETSGSWIAYFIINNEEKQTVENNIMEHEGNMLLIQ